VRPLSRARLERRLAGAGVDGAPRDEALATLERAGLVDDERLAEGRAAALCERGWGDEAIVVRLSAEGIDEAAARRALAGLAPESERAARIAAGVPDLRRLAGLLARRGFGEDVLETVAARLDAGR